MTGVPSRVVATVRLAEELARQGASPLARRSKQLAVRQALDMLEKLPHATRPFDRCPNCQGWTLLIRINDLGWPRC